MTDTLTEALQLAHLGLRIVPIGHGQKWPWLDQWQRRATNNPDTIRQWWTRRPDSGIGIAMGPQPSGHNLFAVDLDTHGEHDGPAQWKTLCDQHGPPPATWESVTGGGGRHLIYTAPPGTIITNTQAAGNRLGPGIDIRGHGGQIVVAPTRHPETGQPYQWSPFRAPGDIDPAPAPAWLLQKLATPAPAVETQQPASTTHRPPPPQRQPPGNDETAADWLRRHWDWPTELGHAGWTHTATKPGGDTWWTRPGKNPRDGHSAVLHGTDGPLVVFTTELPAGLGGKPTVDGSGMSISPLDFYAARHHHGDRGAASRAIRAQMPPTHRQNALSGPQPADTPPASPDDAQPPEPSSKNLPDTFWDARPVLQHIRQAAHSRIVSADAVLINTLARAACLIHPTIVLPPIVGGPGSLNLIGATVAASGGGKTAAKQVAVDLIQLTDRRTVDDVSPGSGEGLVEAFLEFVTEEGPDGKPQKVKRQTKNALFAFVDEGQALIQLGERNGATILTVLRTAWSGGTLGQRNATTETNRRLDAHRYRLGLVIGFQLAYAAQIIADAEGGTPQRVVFAHAVDPTIPDEPVEWPGPLELRPPTVVHGRHTTIDVDPAVVAEIRRNHLSRMRGEIETDPLDSHTYLGRLKIAALLGFLDDGRLAVTEDDWDLAGTVTATSAAVRSWAIGYAAEQASQARKAATAAAVEREAAIAADAASRALSSGARSIGRRVHRVGGVVGRSAVTRAAASRHKTLVAVDEMIEEAERKGWIRPVEGGWTAGDTDPT
jgi:hypothetical protein